jgi:hypothetical protein
MNFWRKGQSQSQRGPAGGPEAEASPSQASAQAGGQTEPSRAGPGETCAQVIATPIHFPITTDKILRHKLIQLSPGDVWTVSDAVQGTQIFGATGTGKTTGSGQTIAVSFLSAGFGGLICTAKLSDVADWYRYFALAGRPLSDLVILSPGTKRRFNFLEHEFAESDETRGNIANIVSLFMNALSSGEAAVSNNDPYWNEALRELLLHGVELASAASGTVRLPDLARLFAEAPTDPSQLRSRRWGASSLTWDFLKAADGRRSRLSDEAFEDLQLTAAYWTRDFPALAEKTRSIILSSFTSKAAGLLRRPLRRMLCTDSSPEVMPANTHRGKVVLLDLPVKEYGEVGRFAQILYKTVWQRATERRKLEGDWKPVFLWADESQYFVTPEDMSFQQTARGAMAATVYLTQNISNYYVALGTRHGHAATDSLLGNLQTKIFHANGDPSTNEWAERVFARIRQRRRSQNLTFMPQRPDQLSGGVQDVVDHAVPAARFTTLRKGGPENEGIVEAMVFQGGRRWATDISVDSRDQFLNYGLVPFRQGRRDQDPAP